MANRGNKVSGGKASADRRESSNYGNGQKDFNSDDVTRADGTDRVEAIVSGADEEPLVPKGKLKRQFAALDASTEEELDALQVDLVQDDDSFDADDGSGRVDDEVAEEQIAEFTEVGPMVDGRGAESVAPGSDDTSALLRRHRPHSQAGNDFDELVEDNIDPPLDEELDEDDPGHFE